MTQILEALKPTALGVRSEQRRLLFLTSLTPFMSK